MAEPPLWGGTAESRERLEAAKSKLEVGGLRRPKPSWRGRGEGGSTLEGGQRNPSSRVGTEAAESTLQVADVRWPAPDWRARSRGFEAAGSKL